MTRYLLIEFDDNNAAERMWGQIDAATQAGKGMRVAGMFGVPTQWCKCPTSDGYHKHEIVRGAKLGWWVHKLCKRARPGSHNLQNLIRPADRSYGVETGRACVVTTVNVFEAPVQNLR